jgi:membrane protease YdiL (CAAX protease family)
LGYDGERLTVPWNAADVVRAVALVIVGFMGLLLLASVVIGAGVMEEQTLRQPWFASSFHGALLLAVWVFGVRKYHTRWSAVGLRRSLDPRAFSLPWLALLLSVVFTVLYAVTVESLGMERFLPPPTEGDILGEGFSRGLNTSVIVLWVPFAEELFFRGFLLAALVAPLGPVRAAILSSIIFAFGHLMLGVMVPFFVTGLLLSWLYLRTRSVWPPITAHAAQNLLALVLST